MVKYIYPNEQPVFMFKYKEYSGCVDIYGYVQWGGCGFHLEDITGDFRAFLDENIEQYKIKPLKEQRHEKRRRTGK